MLRSITDATITGAKGLGEGGAIGAPAAVLNAISDALSHLRLNINELPATPDDMPPGRSAWKTKSEH